MRNTLHQIKDHYFCYVWLLPFFVVFGVFQIYPMLFGLYASLTEWSGVGDMAFVGLGNYSKLFSDEKFWLTLKNTFVLWLYIVPARTFLALGLAYVLNQAWLKLKSGFSFFYLMPNVTSIVVIAFLFRLFLTQNGGVVNYYLGQWFGIAPIPWLDSELLSKVSITFMNLWKNTGYFMILMLAGLQKIPRTLYEAADIDGCNAIQAFRRITLPLMAPTILFVTISSTIAIFQNISDAMVLTAGGPVFSSTPLVYYMYINAFEYFKMGYSSALSIVLFVLLMAISAVVVRLNYQSLED